MFIVEINKENYYYTTEEKALKAIEKLGKIVYHNSINKNNQKILCDKNDMIIKIIMKKVEVDGVIH